MNITDIDFNQLYIQQKKETTFQPKTKDEWNKKAKKFSTNLYKSIYNQELLNNIDFDDCRTFLDIGCGVGNISLLVAEKLDQVYSLDFSPMMLDELKNNIKNKNIKNIKTLNLSWEDNWDNVPKCDIVLASRSMEVADMKYALTKLNNKALKKVYLTYKVGGSFLNDKILNYIGKKIKKKPDYIYTINILYQMGINPKLNYIKSEGKINSYKNENDFIESVLWSVNDLTNNQITLLKEYYHKFIKNSKNEKNYLCWAVISWNKKKKPCL